MSLRLFTFIVHIVNLSSSYITRLKLTLDGVFTPRSRKSLNAAKQSPLFFQNTCQKCTREHCILSPYIHFLLLLLFNFPMSLKHFQVASFKDAHLWISRIRSLLTFLWLSNILYIPGVKEGKENLFFSLMHHYIWCLGKNAPQSAWLATVCQIKKNNKWPVILTEQFQLVHDLS